MRAIAPDMLMRTIVITAASEMTLRDLDRSSVFDLLRKPFDVKDLVSQVKACVAPAGPRQARLQPLEH